MSYHLQWNGVQNFKAKIDSVGDNDEEGEGTFFHAEWFEFGQGERHESDT